MRGPKLRPISTDNYVWCDFHGEVHLAEENYYQVDDEDDCADKNWRTVWISGVKGETF